MNETAMNDPLAQLRDIHLPEPVSWWPPAPGWWLLLLLIVTSALIGWWLWKRYQAQQIKRAALAELNQIEQNYQQHQDSHVLLEQLSQLLRRCALACYPQQQIAGLTGKQWLVFLDKSGNTTGFSEGAGRVLVTGPYKKLPDSIDANELSNLCKQWVSHAFKNGRSFSPREKARMRG